MKQIKSTSKEKFEYFISYRTKAVVDGALIEAKTATEALEELIELIGEDIYLLSFNKL